MECKVCGLERAEMFVIVYAVSRVCDLGHAHSERVTCMTHIEVWDSTVEF